MSSDSIKLQTYVVPLALLAAATRIFIDLIPKLTGMNPIFYYLSFILCFFLEILFIVYVTKSFKEKNNNQLTFQEGLKVGIIIMLITGFFYSVSSFVYDTYIDPNFQVNAILEVVGKYNPNELEKIKQQMEYSKQSPSSIGILTSTIWFIIVGFVISLVTTNFLKSNTEE